MTRSWGTGCNLNSIKCIVADPGNTWASETCTAVEDAWQSGNSNRPASTQPTERYANVGDKQIHVLTMKSVDWSNAVRTQRGNSTRKAGRCPRTEIQKNAGYRTVSGRRRRKLSDPPDGPDSIGTAAGSVMLVLAVACKG